MAYKIVEHKYGRGETISFGKGFITGSCEWDGKMCKSDPPEIKDFPYVVSFNGYRMKKRFKTMDEARVWLAQSMKRIIIKALGESEEFLTYALGKRE